MRDRLSNWFGFYLLFILQLAMAASWVLAVIFNAKVGECLRIFMDMPIFGQLLVLILVMGWIAFTLDSFSYLLFGKSFILFRTRNKWLK